MNGKSAAEIFLALAHGTALTEVPELAKVFEAIGFSIGEDQGQGSVSEDAHGLHARLMALARNRTDKQTSDVICTLMMLATVLKSIAHSELVTATPAVKANVFRYMAIQGIPLN